MNNMFDNSVLKPQTSQSDILNELSKTNSNIDTLRKDMNKSNERFEMANKKESFKNTLAVVFAGAALVISILTFVLTYLL